MVQIDEEEKYNVGRYSTKLYACHMWNQSHASINLPLSEDYRSISHIYTIFYRRANVMRCFGQIRRAIPLFSWQYCHHLTMIRQFCFTYSVYLAGVCGVRNMTIVFCSRNSPSFPDMFSLLSHDDASDRNFHSPLQQVGFS